jgi:hypothetical protein
VKDAFTFVLIVLVTAGLTCASALIGWKCGLGAGAALPAEPEPVQLPAAVCPTPEEARARCWRTVQPCSWKRCP